MKKGAIFFWIPKNAGTSLFHILEGHGGRKLKHLTDLEGFDNRGLVTFGHLDVTELAALGYVSHQFLQDSFKFCFVRNPWDRLLSLYHYREYSDRMTFPDFVLLVERRFRARESLLGRTALRWYRSERFAVSQTHKRVMRIGRRLPSGLQPFMPIPEVGLYNIFDLSQANPQSDWVCDAEGNLLVDFVGRVESFGEDLQKVLDRLGIEGEPVRLNQTRHRDYREYYSDSTRRIVERLYKADIERFGYAFSP